MRTKLVSYGNTPQVTALEYHEMRDLEKNPRKKNYYDKLIAKRTKGDRKKDEHKDKKDEYQEF